MKFYTLLIFALIQPALADVTIDSIKREIHVELPDLAPAGNLTTSSTSSGNFSADLSVSDPDVSLSLSAKQHSFVDTSAGGTVLNIGITANSLLGSRTDNPSSFDDISAYSLIDLTFTVSGLSPFTFNFADSAAINDQSSQAEVSYNYTLTRTAPTAASILSDGLSTSKSDKTTASDSFNESQVLSNGTYHFVLRGEISGKMANSNQQPVSLGQGAAPVPEPGAFLLAGFSLLPLLRRRRR